MKHWNEGDRHRRNILRFIGIKEKYGVESKIWEEREQKGKFFCKKNCALETDEVTIGRAHRIGKKEEEKRRTIIAKFLNYKQREKLLNKYKQLKSWEDQIYINEHFSEYTVEKRRILFKRAKEIWERGEFAKVVYNRHISSTCSFYLRCNEDSLLPRTRYILKIHILIPSITKVFLT